MDNKIKVFREEFNMTQDELAQKTDVSRQTIISLEKGKYNPSILLAYKIAKVFNALIEDVFVFEMDKIN